MIEGRWARFGAGLVMMVGCTHGMGVPGDESASTTGSTNSGFASTGSEASSGTSTESPPRERGSLIDVDAFAAAEASADPFVTERPVTVDCDSDGAHPEGSTFEVLTGFCNYASFSQPALLEVRAGDTVKLSAFHDTLAADEPGEAHISVLLGEHVLWDQTISIPNSPTPYNLSIPVDFTAPAMTPVHFHLHNHGYNTWKLVALDVWPGDAL